MSLETITIVFWLVALFSSITVHEFMHAWSANYLGDPTAKAMGRATLNPIPHIDPIGTVALPLFLILANTGFVFGWAKPVQINPNNFKDYKMGQALTALAGPLGNLMLIAIFALIYNLMPEKNAFGLFIVTMVNLNIILMIFNLIPIPPLDGSKVLYRFISHEAAAKLENYGIFILIPFIFLFSGAVIFPILTFLLNILQVPSVGGYITTYLQ